MKLIFTNNTVKLLPYDSIPSTHCQRCAEPLAHDFSLIDAMAVWECIIGHEAWIDKLRQNLNVGMLDIRAHVATNIIPLVLRNYSEHCQDIDYDGLFVPMILEEMHANNWCLQHDYSAVCVELYAKTQVMITGVRVRDE